MNCNWKSLFLLAVTASICGAFSPTSFAIKACESIQRQRVLVFSSDEESEAPEQPTAPPPSPPPVPKKRLDPLMASMTRMDPETANGPTRNLPLFGEVPVDGSLVVLIPVAVIAIVGFIFSVVVAVNSQDALVASLGQVVNDIAVQANEKTNMVYDENVCRGLCSNQQSDIEGLRSFMEGLKK